MSLINDLQGDLYNATSELEEVRAENAKLREALRGRHTGKCPSKMFLDGTPCSCGLDTALSSTPGLAPAHPRATHAARPTWPKDEEEGK